MPFANKGMTWKASLSHQLGSDNSMTDIRLRTKALDARCIRSKYANVVKHCRFLNKLLVDFQFRMRICYSNSLVCHRTTMNQEYMP